MKPAGRSVCAASWARRSMPKLTDIIATTHVILRVRSTYVAITNTTTFSPQVYKRLEWPGTITWVVIVIIVKTIRHWKKTFLSIFPPPTHRIYAPSIAEKRISVISDLRTENRVGVRTLHRMTMPKWTISIVPSNARETLTNIAEDFRRPRCFA